MAGQRPAAPPRPIAPGDVVAAFSAALGEWTAAQIVHLDAGTQMASVLELAWSIESLDCDRLVRHFPHLTHLTLSGDLGLLSNAAGLNALTSLQRIRITDLFGMGEEDRPRIRPRLVARGGTRRGRAGRGILSIDL